MGFVAHGEDRCSEHLHRESHSAGLLHQGDRLVCVPILRVGSWCSQALFAFRSEGLLCPWQGDITSV